LKNGRVVKISAPEEISLTLINGLEKRLFFSVLNDMANHPMVIILDGWLKVKSSIDG